MAVNTSNTGLPQATTTKDAVSLRLNSAVSQKDSHTYEADLHGAWVTGQIPHGGFIATVFMNVAKKHFETTHAERNQPDTMSLHIEYLRPSNIGPAIIKVQDTKLGRQTSSISLTLEQNGTTKSLAFIIQTNLLTMRGKTWPTNYTLHPPPAPSNPLLLRQHKDPNWQLHRRLPFTKFHKVITRIKCHLPVHGMPHKSIVDEWIQLHNNETFTSTSLGFVCDIFPIIGAAYKYERDPYNPNDTTAVAEGSGNGGVTSWFPTLNCSLEVKKRLPEAGVDLLFVRARAKSVRDGRMDLEVSVWDVEGQLVAVASQIVMVVEVSRNLRPGRKGVEAKL